MNQYFIQFGNGDCCMIIAENKMLAENCALSVYNGDKSQYFVKKVRLEPEAKRRLQTKTPPFAFNRTAIDGDKYRFNYQA